MIQPETITQELLQEITRRIVVERNPEKVILFGSHATNTSTKESDVDLLVVVNESKIPPFERSIPIYLALADISFPIDIVVYTTEEINEWSEVQEAFVTRIIREGKILYEKDAS